MIWLVVSEEELNSKTPPVERRDRWGTLKSNALKAGLPAPRH